MLSQWSLGLCALASAGALRAQAVAPLRPGAISAPFAAVGLRALAELGVASGLSLELHVDVQVTVIRTALWLADESVWTMPRFIGGVGVGGSYQLR